MANFKTINAALNNLNDGNELSSAQQKTVEGENPAIVKHKSGAFIMSPETLKECNEKIKEGNTSAAKALETAKNALETNKTPAPETKAPEVAAPETKAPEVAAPETKMTPDDYQKKFATIKAALLASNGDGPKIPKKDYDPIKKYLQKVEGITILTKEAAREIGNGRRFEGKSKVKNATECYQTATYYRNKVLEAQKTEAPKAEAPKAEAPKVNIKEVADALKAVLADNEISNDTKEKYFKTNDKGEITGLNKDTYMTCVNAASSKRKDSEEKTIATGVVSIAKKAFLPKTPEKTGPEMV